MDTSASQPPSPELRAAIDVAKARVKVDSYYTYGMNKGLKGNSQGTWTGTLIGGTTGLVAGGMIALFAFVAGVTLPVSIPALMVGTMAMGTVTGGTVGSRVGAATGAVSGVVAEFERRMNADKLEQEIMASPQKQREAIAAYRADPVVEKDNTLGEALATSKTKAEGWHKFWDPKTMLLTVTLCTLAGMAIFTGGYALGGGPLLTALGIKAATVSLGAALAVGAGVGSTFGLLFGITGPMLFTGLTKGVADVLSQNKANGRTQYPPIKTAAQMQEEAIQNRALSEPAGNVVAIKPPASALAIMGEQPSTAVNHVAAAERMAQQAVALSQ